MAYCGWEHLRRDLTPGLYNGFSDQVHKELFISAESPSMYKVFTSWLDPFFALIWLQKHWETRCCQAVCSKKSGLNSYGLVSKYDGMLRLSRLHASVYLIHLNVCCSLQLCFSSGLESGLIWAGDSSHHSPISQWHFDRCGCRRSRYGCWGKPLRGEVTVPSSSSWSEASHDSFGSFSSFPVLCGFVSELT